MRLGRVLAIVAVLGVIGLIPAEVSPAGARPKPPAAPKNLNRYSLVHGCYMVKLASGRALGPFRMQAATLGEYLLYNGTYLGAGLATVSAPGQSTVWRVDGHFTMTNLGTGETDAVSFVPASGCQDFPEGQVDATGPTFTGASSVGQVNGTIDAHTHVTAFEFLGGDFHCGRPWDAFGIAYALPDCAPDEQGTNGQVESFLDYGEPSHAHDTVGWPTFHDWPSPTDLAEEGDYYTGIERAWKAGLRVMVTQLVDNEALCELMTTKHNPCNDMDGVRLQAKDLRALQDYVDAQAGGPGKGFFRIVTNPFQARQAINSGKLAVVEGIEVSDLFNCGEYLGVPKCDQAQVDAGLKEVRGLGVSTFFPIHKFDNAFGGTKMDSGETGILVNAGNHLETGSFWDVQTCTGPEHDSTQITVAPPGALGQLMDGSAGSQLLGGAPLPSYPPPPHCNQRGLTDLGAYLLNQMIKQHFIVELDHMDAKTADAALSILEAHHYSGVVSAHSWDSPEENPRIYNLGGFVTPIAGASPQSFIDQWKASLGNRNKRYYNGTGFGYGADMNGLAEQSQPTSGAPITYPFKSYDGKVTFSRETWGQRIFDINKDGVANYGMYPDWLQELQTLAGRPILTDMFHGAEAYLEMWERAYGVPDTGGCVAKSGRIAAAGVGRLKLGQSFESVLYAAGQPASRPGRAYRYCVTGAHGRTVSAVFGARGKVAALLSSAHGYRVGSVRPGARVGTLRQAARSAGRGLWVGRRRLKGGRRYVYGVRRGRVRFVGVVSRGDAHRLRRLRADVRSARV
jgi:hypothetical protein